MAPAKKDKYSVILPTYNERQNLPVLVQMLYDVFSKECVKVRPFAGVADSLQKAGLGDRSR